LLAIFALPFAHNARSFRLVKQVDQLAAAAESALQAAEEDEMANPAGGIGKRSGLSHTVAPPGAKRRRQPIRRKLGGSEEPVGTTAAMAYDSSHLSPSSQSLSPRAEMTEGCWPAAVAGRAASSSAAAAPTVSAPDGDAGSLSAEAAAKRSGGDALLWLSEAAVVGCSVAAGRHPAAGGSESSVSGGSERAGYASGASGRRTSPPWQDEAAGARVASIDRAAGDGGSSAAERTAAATAGASAGKPRRSTAGGASAASTAGFTSPTYDGGHGNGSRTSAAIAARRSMKQQQQLTAPTRGYRKGTKAGVRHATMATGKCYSQSACAGSAGRCVAMSKQRRSSG